MVHQGDGINAAAAATNEPVTPGTTVSFTDKHFTATDNSYFVIGPGNGSPSATNVVVGVLVVRYQISKVLRLFYFTADRH